MITSYPAGGREATPFRLAEASDRSALFENPQHDFPQRILYRLGPDGVLHARAETTVDGTVRHLEWAWRSADFPGAPWADWCPCA